VALKKVKKQGKKSLREMLKSRLGRFLALFLISAWMFVLGVLVGRGTAPVRFEISELDNELAVLKANEQQQQMARVKIDPKAADPKADLEFYEELKKSQKHPELKARQPVKKPKPKSKTPAPEKAQKPADKPSVKQTAKPKTTTAVKNTNKPAATTAAGKEPEAGTPGKSDGLTVQAASLKDPKDADDLVSRLKKKGYPAYKTIAVVPEQGIWFRVRVGRFGSREEANDTLRRLKKDGFDPFLVNRKD
jgi:cell division septation protein DedD